MFICDDMSDHAGWKVSITGTQNSHGLIVWQSVYKIMGRVSMTRVHGWASLWHCPTVILQVAEVDILQFPRVASFH